MRRIVINMQNSLFCNAIADTLRRSGNELEPYTIDSPDKVVDENAEKEVAKQVKQAKKDGLIDQFIYGSISASYLADIVDSL